MPNLQRFLARFWLRDNQSFKLSIFEIESSIGKLKSNSEF